MSTLKNIKFIIGFGFMALAIGLIIHACHKDKPVIPPCTDVTNPACPNYNPCLNQHATSAAFALYEHDGSSLHSNYLKDVLTDTLYQGDDFYLVPAYVPPAGQAKGWTYKYIINNRDTFNTDSTYNFNSRYIQDTFTNGVNGMLKVKLYVHNNNPNQKCFPHDSGTDTLTKFFKTIPTAAYPGFKSAVFGKYQGALTDNLTDTFSVTLLNNVVDPMYGGNGEEISNLYRGCSAYNGYGAQDPSGTYRTIDWHVPNDSECQDISFFAYVNEQTNLITIMFNYKDPSNPSNPVPIAKTFTGRQLWRQY